MPPFIKGLDLSRHFYQDAVKPILDEHFPQLTYSAGLIGSGSEILGYDTEMSSDHHWGPRVMLFLTQADVERYRSDISDTLSEQLPYNFMGYSTHFSDPLFGDGDNGTQLLETISEGKINHRVDILTIDDAMRHILGFESSYRPTPADWLSLPQQKLLSFVAGEIFHDDLHLSDIREQFAYYPHDVWLYLMACSWTRISQDEHLAPRAGHAGDELGSAVIAGRLVRSIMQLCFLIERRYAPYPKWFGTAFAQLECAEKMMPILRTVQLGSNYRDRERALVEAYSVLNTLHNDLDLTEPITPAVSDFHGRPFQVSHGWRYSDALIANISAPAVRVIALHTLIGNIDQISDNTNLRESIRLYPVLAQLYQVDPQ